MTISEIVKHYRGKTSLRDFADKIGVSHAAVQQWENGDTEPTDERVNLFVNDKRPWVKEMGKALFLARNGKTLRTIVDGK